MQGSCASAVDVTRANTSGSLDRDSPSPLADCVWHLLFGSPPLPHVSKWSCFSTAQERWERSARHGLKRASKPPSPTGTPTASSSLFVYALPTPSTHTHSHTHTHTHIWSDMQFDSRYAHGMAAAIALLLRNIGALITAAFHSKPTLQVA